MISIFFPKSWLENKALSSFSKFLLMLKILKPPAEDYWKFLHGNLWPLLLNSHPWLPISYTCNKVCWYAYPAYSKLFTCCMSAWVNNIMTLGKEIIPFVFSLWHNKCYLFSCAGSWYSQLHVSWTACRYSLWI